MSSVPAADPRMFRTLLGVQTLGASILYWFMIPYYRLVLADPTVYQAEVWSLLFALPSIGLLQLGYWFNVRNQVPLPKVVHPVLGHIVLCAARLGFILVSGVFSLVFLAPRPGFSIPVGRAVVTTLGIFAMFCYTRELERVGRALLARVPDQ